MKAFVAFVPLSLAAVSMPTNLFLFSLTTCFAIYLAKSEKAVNKEERMESSSIIWEVRYFFQRK